MAQEFSKKFYNSKQWKDCRSSYISKRIALDGGMCETCGQVRGYIVHHKIRLTPENINDTSISLNHNYLKYDCHICHNSEESGHNGMLRKGLVLDANGNIKAKE